MKMAFIGAMLMLGLISYPASAQEFELHVPIGWGDLTKNDFCERVVVAGQSGCKVDRVSLFGTTAADVTALTMRGSLNQIEEQLQQASKGDFVPFPWSRSLQQYSEMMGKFNFDPSDLPLTVESCAFVNVAPGCTCINKPLGGYVIACNDSPGAMPNISVPSLPLGYLRRQ